MKKHLTLFVLAFALISFNFSPKEVLINWSKTSFDLGKVSLNKPTEATFSFENTGDSPIVILEAKASCGCTVASYTEGEILPGDSGMVKATYNAKKMGVFSKTVKVTLTGTNEPIVLTLKGEVI